MAKMSKNRNKNFLQNKEKTRGYYLQAKMEKRPVTSLGNTKNREEYIKNSNNRKIRAKWALVLEL